MNKIRVLSDHLSNQIAAGEVVERPASVIKELVENSLDAGARRVQVDVELGGRRLMRVTDDGEGMTRDDAVLAFERHATSKITRLEDLAKIETLGFRGEALASIASVAKVELVTKTADAQAATRVSIEGGRLVDVKDAARPQGTTITVRDLFFNTPARRKFMRSEATENYHLTSIVTHYALAQPDAAFALTNNGREIFRLAPARDLRERAFQIFGASLIESLLPVEGGREYVAKIRGFVSAPRERRTTRDAQYFFINGRFVRDKTISGGLLEGFRSVLPHGVYPVAFLFLDIPVEEVDVNVHPAKTEVRFRRTEAVKETIAEAIRGALQKAGIAGNADLGMRNADSAGRRQQLQAEERFQPKIDFVPAPLHGQTNLIENPVSFESVPAFDQNETLTCGGGGEEGEDRRIFEGNSSDETERQTPTGGRQAADESKSLDVFSSDFEKAASEKSVENFPPAVDTQDRELADEERKTDFRLRALDPAELQTQLPPVDSAAKLVKTAEVENLSSARIRPVGQLHESYIIAVDDEGLLLVDQHVAHERILFDKFRRRETERKIESQNLLLPETLDLTPAQAVAFNLVEGELESLGFALMRLSGRTVAIKAVPSDLPPSEARNLLAEVLDTVDKEKSGGAKAALRDDIAASLACKAAVKVNMKLTPEKMQWLIDRLLTTSSPTTCPHGRPVVLRLTMRDIERGFHRS